MTTSSNLLLAQVLLVVQDFQEEALNAAGGSALPSREFIALMDKHGDRLVEKLTDLGWVRR